VEGLQRAYDALVTAFGQAAWVRGMPGKPDHAGGSMRPVDLPSANGYPFDVGQVIEALRDVPGEGRVANR
jgi:hypothetical protein